MKSTVRGPTSGRPRNRRAHDRTPLPPLPRQGEDIGEAAFATLDCNIGDTFKTDGVCYEILDVLQVPEAMGSEHVGIWTVTPVELAEPAGSA